MSKLALRHFWSGWETWNLWKFKEPIIISSWGSEIFLISWLFFFWLNFILKFGGDRRILWRL